MSIGSIGSNASQVWHHQKESKTQQASSTNSTGSAQASRRGSFPDVQADAASSPASMGASTSTGTGTSGSKGISGPASKLIADVNSLLISLQAGNSATGAATTASSAGTAAASGGATASAASSATAGSSATGSLSQDQLAGLSTVLDDLSKVHGGSRHHGHGASPSGSQSADAGGTAAAAVPGAGAAPPAPPASGSTSSDLLTQLGKALSAYVTSQASTTSQPSTLIAA